jgi:hypothetical protein
VLDVAAGNIDPLTGAADAASETAIVFVQLPLLTVADSSGGSMAVHVLDALRYILDVSADDARVVVNLSYGTLAGPHDGSTLIERAMDDLLEKREKNFAIVLGAGNERKLRGHARKTVSRSKPCTLEWRVLDEDPTDSFLEIWYSSDGKADPGLSIEVAPPDGPSSGRLALGERARLDTRDGVCIAAVMHESNVPNGVGPMILVAQTPTDVSDDAEDADRRASAGVWKVTLRSEAPCRIDAWIERDDTPTRLGSRQSFFDDEVDEQGTLSNLATGRYTIVVGGCRLSDGREVSYSSQGPARKSVEPRHLPDILGACEENEARGGIRATAVRSGQPYRMNGTSAAAPVVARRLFAAMRQRGSVGRAAWTGLLKTLTSRADRVRGRYYTTLRGTSTNGAGRASQPPSGPIRKPGTHPSTGPSAGGSPSPGSSPPDLQFPYALEDVR